MIRKILVKIREPDPCYRLDLDRKYTGKRAPAPNVLVKPGDRDAKLLRKPGLRSGICL